MASSTPDTQGDAKFSNFTLSAMLEAERTTGVPALAMLKQTGLVPSPPVHARILDNACGSGVVAKCLHEQVSNADFKLLCGDLDQTMVHMTSNLIQEQRWTSVTVECVDAHATGFADGEFSHVLMNFGPQLMGDAEAALGETYRILRSGGVMGTTCWVKAGWVPSVTAVFPDFKPPGLLQADTWKSPKRIREVLTGVGFEDVDVRECEFVNRVEGENVGSFLELMGLLVLKLLDGENKEKYDRHMRDEVQKGSVEMSWMALTVSAKKPQA